MHLRNHFILSDTSLSHIISELFPYSQLFVTLDFKSNLFSVHGIHGPVYRHLAHNKKEYGGHESKHGGQRLVIIAILTRLGGCPIKFH